MRNRFYKRLGKIVVEKGKVSGNLDGVFDANLPFGMFFNNFSESTEYCLRRQEVAAAGRSLRYGHRMTEACLADVLRFMLSSAYPVMKETYKRNHSAVNIEKMFPIFLTSSYSPI